MFTLNQEYERSDLLSFVGSKQGQSGIIWGEKDPTCVIITSGGRHGKRAGYSDIRNPDGSFEYIGQGTEGDQDPARFSNSLLVKGERTILYFSTREPNALEVRVRGNHRKFYRFEGIFEVASWDTFIPLDGTRTGNVLLKFILVPASNVYSATPQLDILEESSQLYGSNALVLLRNKIVQKNLQPLRGVSSTREYISRSQDIVQYAKWRADGVCELCESGAPFIDTYKLPFLEVHHIHRLADDGPDAPQNVAAICPNCHREAHYGFYRDNIRRDLSGIILNKEVRYM